MRADSLDDSVDDPGGQPSMLPMTAPRAACFAATAVWVATLMTVLAARSALACDICALHSSTVLDPPRPGFSIHATEQFTSYNTYKNAGDTNLPVNEWLQTSITNVVLGYGFVRPVRLELTVPFINREFYRLKDQADRSR